MNSNKSLFFTLFLVLVTGCGLDSLSANTHSDEVNVKKSSSNICHDATSASYKRTKNFTAYESLSACLNSGGRLAKGQMNEAVREADNENRDFVVLYERSDWPHWSDEDGDCQNTRHELLLATSQSSVEFKSTKECNVITGSWYDPYSGDTISDSRALDLDHVVPLKFAHGHGAAAWSRERKRQFANDVDNLLLVRASLNRQKGSKGPDEWMPPNHSYRCDYLKTFNIIMVKYELQYIPSERRIIGKMLKACKRSS